jgi:CRISPR-associated protein Cas1
MIRARGTRLIIQRGEETLRWIPSQQVSQLVLVGPVQISYGARCLCLKAGLDVIFLNTAGAYLGRLVGPMPAYSELRWQQYQKLHDSAFALACAREIVRGKIVNQRNLLLKRTKPTDATTQLRALINQLPHTTTMDEIRGHEGRAAALYFGAFGGLISNDAFTFTNRNRQPPRDPVNILLSLGYTILVARVEAAIWQSGLDVALGTLHAQERGRPALALDLAEGFRPTIVDATVLRCLNLRILTPDDFLPATASVDYLAGDPGQPERPLLFKKDALARFLRELDRKFLTQVFYEPLSAKYAYRDIILHQIRALIRSLDGKDVFTSFTPPPA